MYFYLIFGILLYLIFTRILENYINIDQENFDPSLVPISSIISLSKVAQKLINENGTLINPGNLQLGASTSTPGNLTVTGLTNISGNTTLNTLNTPGLSTFNSLGVKGNTVLSGTLSVTGDTTSPQFHTSGSSGAFHINPRSGTGSYTWYNPDGSSVNLWSNSLNKDIITFDNTGTTNMINAKASDTLNVKGTSTLGATNISGNLVATGATNSFKNGTIGTSWFPYTDGVNYIRGNLQIDGNTTINGTIKSGHTFVYQTSIRSPANGGTSDIINTSLLVSGVTYLAEAHFYFYRSGSGFDGTNIYFMQGGSIVGLPGSMGYDNNILDLGGIAQNNQWGGMAPRKSAVAIITGPNVQLRLKCGNDDSWNIYILAVFTPTTALP